ncbi:hypothetical protein BGW36DRAFT_412039 [Talaromyces proteolyticus]|uniref:Cyanovirin-N domain-containing protein n=1 Tax=Talaromyces proteolyticus TaxID=1131652 RepID=A0AAD4KFY1_9EURO|nr:uncharacterized protein BGW36DRAFT_412039 [Talaromyces proteolyticus]KAH8690218.1 hypothetical protein BGW36DRAFT_412039 [Talaromyces proteolyticus]
MRSTFFLAAIALFGSTTVNAGGFSSTCTECRLGSSNTRYGCLCGDGKGNEIYSLVDLNDCMVNLGGQLSPRKSGGFGGSCKADGQNDEYTPCWDCGNGSGTDKACPDLNSFISNHDGTISCDV